MRFLRFLLLLAVVPFAVAAELPITLERGVQSDGRITASWKSAIRERHDPAEFARLIKQTRTLQPEEIAWLDLIESRLDAWRRTIPALNAPFDGVTPPAKLTILVGNIGGNDGFTYKADILCLDLADWQASYGAAGAPGNDDRVQRVLSHEYTHLLVARRDALHPFPRTTPYRRALYRLFNEGIANYYSLRPALRAEDGVLPEAARAVQARNVPILVERLRQLQTASVADEAALTHNMTSGPFDQKWGAVTIALWLSREQSRDPGALRRFVAAGPEAVPAFIERNLQKTDP